MNVITNKWKNVQRARHIEFAEFHRVEAGGSGQRKDYNASNDELFKLKRKLCAIRYGKQLI